VEEHGSDKLWKREFEKRWREREAWRDRKMRRMEREMEDLKRRLNYWDKEAEEKWRREKRIRLERERKEKMERDVRERVQIEERERKFVKNSERSAAKSKQTFVMNSLAD